MFLCATLLLTEYVVAIAEYYNQHPMFYKDEDDVSSIHPASSSAVEEESTFVDVPVSKYSTGAVKSLRIGRFKTDVENIGDFLQREMQDMSPDLHERLTDTIAHSNVDHKKYRDVFLIRKRVVDDGRRKIVDLNIREKIIPRRRWEDVGGISRDLWTRSFIGGIMFLIIGLAFTATMKTYRNTLWKKNRFVLWRKDAHTNSQCLDNIQ